VQGPSSPATDDLHSSGVPPSGLTCPPRRRTASRPVGRTAAACECRGKSGLHGTTMPGNARRGRPQGQRHRDRTAAPAGAVRVKRCGKSAPRAWQQGRHGKPHREQDRIGMTRAPQGAQACSGPVVRVGCSRRLATGVPEEWPSRRGQPRPSRTRLTGRLALFAIIARQTAAGLRRPRGGGYRAVQ